jgi:hypothetical protein
VTILAGRIVGTQLRLANGSLAWGYLGNLSLTNRRATQHFLSLSVARDGRWFHLARSHQHFTSCAPSDLAEFLDLPIESVFPIAYDVSAHCSGQSDLVAGLMSQDPAPELSEEELMELAITTALDEDGD